MFMNIYLRISTYIYVYLWISMKCWELYGPLDNSFFGPGVRAEYRGARHARRWAGAGAECSGGAAAGGAALHSPANIIYI